MWPFSRKKTECARLSPEELAVLFCARKWSFFVERAKFPEELPLAGQIELFTTRMRETLLLEVPALGSVTEEELQDYVRRGILISSPAELAKLGMVRIPL